MTRILQVGKYYYPYTGGVETVLRGITRTLDAYEDVTVEVLVYNDAPRTVSELVEGIPVTRVGSLGTVASQAICPTMPYWLARADADVVNLHLPNPLAGLSCLLAKT